MDATPSGPPASPATPATPVTPRPAPRRWLWMALALGTAAALYALVGQQFWQMALGLVTSISIVAPLVDALFPYLIFVEYLTLPVGVVLGALAVARWRRGIADADRRAASLRLLATLGAQVAILVALYVTVRALLPSEAALATPFGQAELATVGFVSFAIPWFIVGVSLAVVMAALLEESVWARRPGDWALAGIVAGLPLGIVWLINPLLEAAIVAVRLATEGVGGCVAGSGSGCFFGVLPGLLIFHGLSPWAGAAIGVVAGGAIAPSLAPSSTSAPPATATPPSPPAARRAWRYVAAAGAGLLYLALIAGVSYLGMLTDTSAEPLSPSRALTLAISVAIDSLALILPAAAIAAALARRRIAERLGLWGGRAALRAMTAAALATLALLLPLVNLIAPSLAIGLDVSALLLTAFTFGAALGLLWADSARMALAGWSGIALLASALVAYGFYTLTGVSAPARCGGLACGALLMAGYSAIIGMGVYATLFALPAAVFGGWLAGLLRGALAGDQGTRAATRAA